MSETSLNNGYYWNQRMLQRWRQRFQTLAPYAALSVIAGIVFGTWSSHPF
jgi:hypothetical protein